MPYLGFFKRKDADRWQRKLESQGYEVYRPVAGAYSTLGWFRDPILLLMLEWDTYQLADTVLHEMVHATLWIRGSVKFNESFANFVGEAAAFRYLRNRYGADAPVHLGAIQLKEDRDQWRAVLGELYADLDEVYKDRTLSETEKQNRKAALFTSLRKRVAGVKFHDAARFLKMAKGTWNNARMMQYRTYNHNRDRFQALLDEENGDLLRFIGRIQVITQKRKNPFKALDEATESSRAEGIIR